MRQVVVDNPAREAARAELLVAVHVRGQVFALPGIRGEAPVLGEHRVPLYFRETSVAL